MAKIPVIAHQSIFDISVQQHGSVLQAFAWALSNGKSITEDLVPGSIMNAPEDESWRSEEVANYFIGKQKQIACGQVADAGLIPFPEGISFWAVDVDFIVQ